MSTPTYPTPVRGTEKRLAVSEDGTTFLKVFGVQSYSFSPTINTADNSDLNSGFWGADNVPVSGSWTGTATVLRRHNGTAYDPAQEILREAVLDKIWVRWWETSFTAAEAWQARASVTWTPGEVNREGLQTVSVTFEIEGEPEAVTNPGDDPEPDPGP